MLIRPPDVPLPSPNSIEKAKIELDRRIGTSKLLTEAESCRAYAIDQSDVSGRLPDMVVLAETVADVVSALEIAERTGVPVTPRAGGTGRSGGAVPVAGGIVLSMSKLARLKGIESDDLLAVVEPGMITGALHAACEAEGLFYPPDPNSLDSSMIGGNVAENAGGPRAFKYGVTREYVLGVEAVLVGGEVLRPGRRTIKGVTGYDVTSLLVGSEGTLAVFTEITLRLVRKPASIATLLGLFSDVHAAAGSVKAIIDAGLVPRCLELMDARTLDAVRNSGAPVDPRAGAMLLIEVDGDAAVIESQIGQLGELLTNASGCFDVLVAQDAAQRARLWSARKSLSLATRKLAKFKLSEDIVVPRSRMGSLLERVEGIGERLRVQHLTYGHAGDGNLHVNFLWNDDSERARVDQAIYELMEATVEMGGTLSGEHGIGVTKLHYLPIEQSPGLIDLQRRIKAAFDPKGLLNPGKIFAPDQHRAC